MCLKYVFAAETYTSSCCVIGFWIGEQVEESAETLFIMPFNYFLEFHMLCVKNIYLYEMVLESCQLYSVQNHCFVNWYIS